MGTNDFNSRGASTRPSAKPAFSSPDDDSEVHFSDTRKVAIDQRDADDRPLTASDSPRLLGVSCLDVILVGIRPRESLGDRGEQLRDVLRRLPVAPNNESFTGQATARGVIASICSDTRSRASSSS